MHGAITHFDNPVVATKAWNMLFAVADWATATIKARAPQPEEPSLSDTFEQLRRNKRIRDQLDSWRPAMHLSRGEGVCRTGDHAADQ